LLSLKGVQCVKHRPLTAWNFSQNTSHLVVLKLTFFTGDWINLVMCCRCQER
jgi:hypothetical protein